MSLQPASFACDVCGKARNKDTNHWLILNYEKVDAAADCNPIVDNVRMMKWHEQTASFSYNSHACGQACALVMVTRWLDHGDFTDGKAKS